ncbi:MAG: cation transporter [Gammaproteobacteria bacterium]|nr:cation transporter [Gammaproteobacteria bacterium]
MSTEFKLTSLEKNNGVSHAKKTILICLSSKTLLLLLARDCAVSVTSPMNCAMCQITVKKALTRVMCVIEANVSYERMQAMVAFEGTQTSIKELVKATTNAGFPSTVY